MSGAVRTVHSQDRDIRAGPCLPKDLLAWTVVETMVARLLTYFAAREKDSSRRSDIEAGMAKLLAARVRGLLTSRRN